MKTDTYWSICWKISIFHKEFMFKYFWKDRIDFSVCIFRYNINLFFKDLSVLCNIHFKYYYYIYQKKTFAIQGFSSIETRILIKIENKKKMNFLYFIHRLKNIKLNEEKSISC